MWSRYDADVVREELATLAAHGLTATRSFCFWPDFVPEPGVLDPEVAARFADFLDAHVETGLVTIPTFLVGHMSGENWDPAWRRGRDLYRDVTLVAEEAWLAAEIAGRFGGHEAIAGWLVSNEMPLYGGPASAEEITAWARILVQAVRSAGATQPISLGDGAWGAETTGDDNGFSLRALAPLVDFVGPHAYPMADDPLRRTLAPAFACELADGFGRPVVLEEFGATSDFGSDDDIAGYYRQVLHTTLLAGARGWLAWCNTDFDDLADEDPYRHHGFELHFGLTAADGTPKPQLEAMGEFAALVRELDAVGWERVAGEVALVVPEHFEAAVPFTTPEYRHDLRDDLFHAYAAAREADLPVRLVRERDGIPAGARLYLVPCAKLLTAPGLRRLGELADAGATVYLSWFAGSTANQRGAWLPWLEELFGVRHLLRYGLLDPIVDDEVGLELVRPLGSSPRASGSSSRCRRTQAPVRSSRSSRQRRKSSRSTDTAARRSCGTGAARARRSSAPIQSSTWPPARRGRTRRTPGGSTALSPAPPASTGPSASPTRASSRAGSAPVTASAPCSSTGRATRSTPRCSPSRATRSSRAR